MNQFIQLWGDAAFTALAFFWKAGWAFILGYSVSAMIQSFVPKARLTPYMGGAGLKSISLASLFGAISSSCSFAALSATRSLVQKGAHFTAAVAFMFASTNLVIELGILIFIFLGWQFLAAEIVGGIFLIAISSILIQLTYPSAWLKQAREQAKSGTEDPDDDFNPWARMKSREGWLQVGRRFVMEWKMVWQEILIGFTIAGVMAVFVPDSFWETLFLAHGLEDGQGVSFLIALENALIAPFVAAATFIGSMGNIPLATVLSAGGVSFAGIMGFIYSDLLVPPLVNVNAKYYGWKPALYIAAIMYVSIVITALTLHFSFAALGILPESTRAIGETARFEIDYTFWMNLVFLIVGIVMIALSRMPMENEGHHGHDHGGHGGGFSIKQTATWTAIAFLTAGLVLKAL